MKLYELTYSGRRKMRHVKDGLRVEISKDERYDVVQHIKKQLKLDGEIGMYGDKGNGTVVFTSPEQATTFPCEIRVAVPKANDAFDETSMTGKIYPKLVSAAIRKAFEVAMGIEVSPVLDSDHHANALRYIDYKVGWAGK
jgi:hypothetical protein